jgi:hypothetical protein
VIGLAHVARRHKLIKLHLYGRFGIAGSGGKFEVLHVTRFCGYDLDGRWSIVDVVLAKGSAAYRSARAAGDLPCS